MIIPARRTATTPGFTIAPTLRNPKQITLEQTSFKKTFLLTVALPKSAILLVDRLPLALVPVSLRSRVCAGAADEAVAGPAAHVALAHGPVGPAAVHYVGAVSRIARILFTESLISRHKKWLVWKIIILQHRQKIPGHSPSLQGTTHVESPEHGSPPGPGLGLVQVLLIVLSPSPQGSEQGPGDHADQ